MPANTEVPETSPTARQRVSYTPAEFAQLTGMKPNTVRAAIRRSEIKATKVGGLYYISHLEVERLFGTAA